MTSSFGDIDLYAFQEEVLQAVRPVLNTEQSLLIQMPYGTGKTILALEIMEEYMVNRAQHPKYVSFFTSGGDGGSMRVYQAKQIAREHGYAQVLKKDTERKYQRALRKEDQRVLQQLKNNPVVSDYNPHYSEEQQQTVQTDFIPITQLVKELELSDWDQVAFVVIDEIDEILIKDFEGYRGYNISVQFSEFMNIRHEKQIPVIGLTGCQDPDQLAALLHYLDIEKQHIFGSEIEPIDEYISTIETVSNDAFVELLDNTFRERISRLIGEIIHLANLSDVNKDQVYDFVFNGISKVVGRYYKNQEQDQYRVYIREHDRQLYISANQMKYIIEANKELKWLLINRIILLNSTAEHLIDIFNRRIQMTEEVWEVMSSYFDEDTSRWTTLIRGGYSDVLAICQELLERLDPVIDYYQRLYIIAFLRAKRAESAPLYGKILLAVSLTKKALENNEQVIIMTRYIKMAKELANQIQRFNPDYDIAYLTGQNTEKQRQTILRDFREEKIRALVLNKIGSKGLDFPNAETIIHVDIDSNPETMRQRTARIRGGKERLLVYKNTREIYKIKTYIENSADQELQEQFKVIISEDQQKTEQQEDFTDYEATIAQD